MEPFALNRVELSVEKSVSTQQEKNMSFWNLVELISVAGAVAVLADMALLAGQQEKRAPVRVRAEDARNQDD